MTTTDPLDLEWLEFDNLEELIDLSELTDLDFAEFLIEQYPETKEIATQTLTEEEGTIEALEVKREATEVTL